MESIKVEKIMDPEMLLGFGTPKTSETEKQLETEFLHFVTNKKNKIIGTGTL